MIYVKIIQEVMWMNFLALEATWTYIFIAGFLGLAAMIATSVYTILKHKKARQKLYDVSAMTQVLDKNNITSINFVRNKIVIEFINIDAFKPEALQECGAQGISIVGDKIKFYIEGTNELNNDLFIQLKQHIEG